MPKSYSGMRSPWLVSAQGAAAYWFQKAVASADDQFMEPAKEALAALEASIQTASDHEDALFDELDRRNLPPEDLKNPEF